MDYQIYYWSVLGLFLVAAYTIIADPNVTTFIILLYKAAIVNIRRFIFLVKIYPRLRYDTIVLKWKSAKILKANSKLPGKSGRL